MIAHQFNTFTAAIAALVTATHTADVERTITRNNIVDELCGLAVNVRQMQTIVDDLTHRLTYDTSVRVVFVRNAQTHSVTGMACSSCAPDDYGFDLYAPIAAYPLATH